MNRVVPYLKTSDFELRKLFFTKIDKNIVQEFVLFLFKQLKI